MDHSKSTYDVSPGALRVLMDSFWSAAGWKQSASLPQGEYMEAAVGSGLMFHAPVALDHDAWVARARAAVAATTTSEVGESFVASLTSRRLDLRSAIGSFAVARHLAPHEYRGGGTGLCLVCNLREGPLVEDLNVLNFERFKWGGVRRLDVRYLAFDLEQFARAPRLEMTTADVEAGRRLLAALKAASPSETATTVAIGLSDLKGNKAERGVVMDILGVTGVLSSPTHPGFRHTFIPEVKRQLPPHHYVERAYPTCWWRAADGIDDDAVIEFLPQLH